MAESSKENSPILKKKRARSTNFSSKEISVLVAEYSKVKCTLEGTKVPNSIKSKLWETIAYKVSEAGTAHRSAKEVKTKWANLSRVSKQTNCEYKNSFTKTGGGPPISSPRGLIKEIIELNDSSEHFNGIDGGLETEINTDLYTDQTLQDEDLQANGDDVRLNESNKGNKLTVSDTVEVIRPVDVDVEIVQTKSDMPDQLNHRNKPITETQRRKRQKVTQEMVWEAQIQFFREQTATERRRRQLMDVKEKFYTAATKALQDKEISDIMDILNSNTEP